MTKPARSSHSPMPFSSSFLFLLIFLFSLALSLSPSSFTISTKQPPLHLHSQTTELSSLHHHRSESTGTHQLLSVSHQLLSVSHQLLSVSQVSFYFDCESSFSDQDGSKAHPFRDFNQTGFSDSYKSSLSFHLFGKNCLYSYTVQKQLSCFSLEIVGSENSLLFSTSMTLQPFNDLSSFSLTLKNLTVSTDPENELRNAFFIVQNDKKSKLSLEDVGFCSISLSFQPVFMMSFQNIEMTRVTMTKMNKKLLSWLGHYDWPVNIKIKGLFVSQMEIYSMDMIGVASVQFLELEDLSFLDSEIINAIPRLMHFEGRQNNGSIATISNFQMKDSSIANFLACLDFDSVVLENITVSNSSLAELFDFSAQNDIKISNVSFGSGSTLGKMVISINFKEILHKTNLFLNGLSVSKSTFSYLASVFHFLHFNKAILENISFKSNTMENLNIENPGSLVQVFKTQETHLANCSVVSNSLKNTTDSQIILFYLKRNNWIEISNVSSTENRPASVLVSDHPNCFSGFLIDEANGLEFNRLRVNRSFICGSFFLFTDPRQFFSKFLLNDFKLTENYLTTSKLEIFTDKIGLVSITGAPDVTVNGMNCHSNRFETSIYELGKGLSTAVCLSVHTFSDVSINDSYFSRNAVILHLKREFNSDKSDEIKTPNVQNAIWAFAKNVQITNSFFYRNSHESLQGKGNSAFIMAYDSVTIRNSTFKENWGLECPSLYIMGIQELSVSIEKSSFTHNSAFLFYNGNSLCLDGFGDLLIDVFDSFFSANPDENYEENNFFLKISSPLSKLEMHVEDSSFDVSNQNVLLLNLPSNRFDVTFEGNDFFQNKSNYEGDPWLNSIFCIESYDDVSAINFELQYDVRDISIWDISSWGSLNLVDNNFTDVQAEAVVYNEVYWVNFDSNRFISSHLQYFAQGPLSSVFWTNNTVVNGTFERLLNPFSVSFLSRIFQNDSQVQNITLFMEDSEFIGVEFTTFFNVSHSSITIRNSLFTNFSAEFASFFSISKSNLIFQNNSLSNGSAWIGAVGYIEKSWVLFSDNTVSNVTGFSGCLISSLAINDDKKLRKIGSKPRFNCTSLVTPLFPNFIYSNESSSLKLKRLVPSESRDQYNCNISDWESLLKTKTKRIPLMSETLQKYCQPVKFTHLENKSAKGEHEQVWLVPGLSFDQDVVLTIEDKADVTLFLPLIMNLVTMDKTICLMRASYYKKDSEGSYSKTSEEIEFKLLPSETSYSLDKFTRNATKWADNDTDEETGSPKPNVLVTVGISLPFEPLNFEIFRSFCPIGYTYKHSEAHGYQSLFRHCMRCPEESYSIPEQNVPCTVCPQYSSCFDGSIYLGIDQWRLNSTSEIFFVCKNSEACLSESSIIPEEYFYLNEKFFNDSKYPLSVELLQSPFCNQTAGYIGPLCLSCDFFNITGQGRFYTDNLGYCKKCESKPFLWGYIIIQFLIQFFSVFFVIIVQKFSTTNLNKKKNQIDSTSLLKMIIIFYQILENISSITMFTGGFGNFQVFDWTPALNFLGKVLAFCFPLRATFFNFTAPFPCLISDPGPKDFLDLVQVETYSFIFFSGGCFLLIFLINMLWSYETPLWYHLIGDFLVFYAIIAPYIVGYAVRVMGSVKIFQENVSGRSLSVSMAMMILEEDTPELVFPKIVMGISLLVVLTIPLVIWGHLRHLRRKTKSKNQPDGQLKTKKENYFHITYLFLVGDYKKSAFDYEIIRIYLLRILVTALCNDMVLVINLKIIILAIIFFIYIIVNVAKKPFRNDFLNNFDFYLGFFVITTLSLQTMMILEAGFITKEDFGVSDSNPFQLFFVFLMVYLTMIAAMMLVWLWYMFKLIRSDFKEFRRKLYEKKHWNGIEKANFTQSLIIPSDERSKQLSQLTMSIVQPSQPSKKSLYV